MSDAGENHSELLEYTSAIVAAHTANNHVPTADLAESIQSVYATLAGLSVPKEEPPVELVPAVPVKKSVTDEHIICLEDGKKLKMLKRHLKTSYDLTPEEYRAKWSLPYDYPMVAPAYAKKRQELAKKIGLGRKPKAAPARKPRSRAKAS
ncbi:MAG: MucR family transcriptional regulator [Pseudomonadota bacterium]